MGGVCFMEDVRKFWDMTADSDWYMELRSRERIERLAKAPESAFHPGALEILKRVAPDFSGKRVLLPSSGDNHAAFALAMMGAKVVSTDISERQLEHAAGIASRLGLDIEFRVEDTMRLDGISDGGFDLVYTSNGTLTWIYDLEGMFYNISRVLKTGGAYVLYDIHPFGRPFSGEPWKQPEIVKAYDDVLPSCHWRVSDIVNALAGAGMMVSEMAELPAADASFWFKFEEFIRKTPEEVDGINDWRKNPMAALPAWIAAEARKS